MIRKLKIKFIAIIMMITSIVLIIIFGSVNFAMSQFGNQQSLDMMNSIIRNDGRTQLPKIKKNPSDKEPINNRRPQNNFLVKLNYLNDILEIRKEGNINYSDDEIEKLVYLALKENKTFGMISSERFLIDLKPNGKLILFVDNSIEKDIEIRLMWTSISICSASLILIFFLALILSDWAIKPVKNSFEKQRQFVADASHELKTPLTVVLANIDVLKDEIGNNKWLEFIKMEMNRMSELTNNLLYLAKNDSDENVYNMKLFNLSEAIMTSTLPFESVAFENERNIIIDIEENIYIKGDENRIKQVVIILIDNAIKNANKNGEIKVSLKLHSNKKVISVFNSGDGIKEEDKSKIFERFYRSDSSRARDTGGYGLGLSIAKSIIYGHGGKIQVESEVGKGAKFIVSL